MLKVTLTGVNLMGNNEPTLRDELGDNLLADISKTKDGIHFRSLCSKTEVWDSMKASCTICETIDPAKPYRDSEMANDDPAQRCSNEKPTDKDSANDAEKDSSKESSATSLAIYSAISIFLLSRSV